MDFDCQHKVECMELVSIWQLIRQKVLNKYLYKGMWDVSSFLLISHQSTHTQNLEISGFSTAHAYK